MSQKNTEPEKKEKKTLTVREYKKQTGATVSESLKERNKINNKLRKAIFKALEEGPMTVPEIALKIAIPSHEVLWHVATSLRYREIAPVEKTDEDYWKYQLVK